MSITFIGVNFLHLWAKIRRWTLVKMICCCHLLLIAVILGSLVIPEVSGIKVSILTYSEFYVNCKAEDLINPNVVILFEILDFNHQALLYKDTDIYDRDNFYRVAWGKFSLI